MYLNGRGTINWQSVKNSNVDFAFVRIAYGSNYLDKTYDYNMQQAEQAGVPVGTYIYSTATTPAMALREAKLAIEKMDGYKVSYPVVFDLEYSQMGQLSTKQVAKLAVVFCNEIKKAGYYPMVYCNTNWYDNEVDWSYLNGIDVWIARYGDTIQARPVLPIIIRSGRPQTVTEAEPKFHCRPDRRYSKWKQCGH